MGLKAANQMVVSFPTQHASLAVLGGEQRPTEAASLAAGRLLSTELVSAAGAVMAGLLWGRCRDRDTDK